MRVFSIVIQLILVFQLCEEAADKIEKGDEVEVDFSTGVITNKTKNETYQSQPFPEFLQKMIDADGLVNYVNSKK